MTSRTCATCRHHRTEKHPRVLDTAFDTVVAFADEDENVYFCTSPQGPSAPYAGMKVGNAPVSCDSWAEPRPLSTELDRLMARAAERAGRKVEER